MKVGSQVCLKLVTMATSIEDQIHNLRSTIPSGEKIVKIDLVNSEIVGLKGIILKKN